LLQGGIIAVMVGMTAASIFRARQDLTIPDFRAGAPPVVNAAGEPPKIDWALLRELNLNTGAATPQLKQHDGNLVRVPGFMVPLEDSADQVTEFLLVPYVGACIHTPPPPANQILQVQTAQKVKVNLYDPIWVTGRFRISTAKSPYGDVAFQVKAESISPYQK
jgi:hypothetical protein